MLRSRVGEFAASVELSLLVADLFANAEGHSLRLMLVRAGIMG
jgi:hypothetical protein